MSDLYFSPEQIVKQEQYKDLLREVEQYRLIKTVAQRRPRSPQKAAEALRKAMVGLIRHLPLSPMNPTRV